MAGSDNALVTLHIVGRDGSDAAIRWDRQRFPYLVDVRWPAVGPMLVTVQSRDQRRLQVLAADPATGTTDVLHQEDDDRWVELVPGSPSLLGDGRLVTTGDREGTRRLLIAGSPVTPPGLQVRAIVDAAADRVVFLANEADEPTERHVWQWSMSGGCERLTSARGFAVAAAGGRTVVTRSASPDRVGAVTQVLDGPVLTSLAMTPPITPNLTLLRAGDRKIATAVLLPHGTSPDERLPVLLDPYGGPHVQRVVASADAFVASQWFAEQGFAVVVADGRGTPGRGSEWERAVYRDLAGPVLDDQIEALHAAAVEHPQLDLERVAIRGWSFGGYLAALAVLRRPDVFHAAIAGAPVTEWRLYDTHYTERYLGDPDLDPEPYDRTSLLRDAHRLERPLLLVHGLADDNVVAAHTLQLSSALLAAGRPHQVLPLSGVTHMTPQEVVAENLLLVQLAFLRQALHLDT
jgi:dipeptidyl-peptidase-4